MNIMKFQVLTAASMKMAALWNVAPCSPMEVDRCFRGANCLHHQVDELRRSTFMRLHGAAFQKAVFFMMDTGYGIRRKRR
jgi:hypothetical protein